MSENGLTWEDLNEISWEDMGKLHISWKDACLSKAELLKKMQYKDVPVPAGLYEQFRSICESIPQETKPKFSFINSVRNIVDTSFFICELFEHSEWFIEHAPKLAELLKQVIEYFS